MRDSVRRIAVLLAIPWALCSVSAGGAAPDGADRQAPAFAGRPLADALLELRARGLRIVFTSNVVTPDLVVASEPAASTPRAILDELLAPHGLVARDGPAGSVVVARAPAPAAAGEPTEAGTLLDPSTVFEEVLIVTPSRFSLLRDQPVGTLGLAREEILALPHLGDDLFRALSLLPGASANDVSAQFHVRGGRRDESQIVLDGQELFDAYHLEDYDDALSVVAPATLDSADLMTGGFAAQYGDRMSGVLDLRTVTPRGRPRFRLGLGILGAHAGGGGSFGGERGAWLAEIRRGSLDLVGRLLGDEDPVYWDAYGKLDYRLGERNALRGSFLHAQDELEFDEVENDLVKRFETGYLSSQAWLGLQTLLGRDLYVDSAGSMARVERDRRGAEQEESGEFAILDQRETEVTELRQGWGYQASPAHTVELGWQWRRLETRYDYAGVIDLDDPLAVIRHDGGDAETSFQGPFEEEHDAVYASDRIRLARPLTLQLGLRWDRYRESREEHWSPRVNLAWSPDEASVVRVAWGRFDQSQRTYEVQIEDGETFLYPVERSEHRVLGFERLFRVGPSDRPLALRVEAYRREVDDPRPRYENLFEPINTFPEVEPDRVLVEPERSVAEGVELFLRGEAGADVRWWVNYTYAETEDALDGRWVPRIFDQTHALNLDVDLPLGRRWRLNLAWRFHTGWPTTPIALRPEEDDEGEVHYVPVLGPLDSERLPDYHRLDLRASRSWSLRSAVVGFFVDVQNAYDRGNVAGYDIEIDEDEGVLIRRPEEWPGILASAGVTVEF